ncbi:hypothetical protein YC2023_047465 [Brassica napus]
MMAEKDEELSLFLEMRRREKEEDSLLVNNPHEFVRLRSKPGTSPMFNIPSGAPARKIGPLPDDFLSSEGDKNDYEWLLTPQGEPGCWRVLQQSILEDHSQQQEAGLEELQALVLIQLSQMEEDREGNHAHRQEEDHRCTLVVALFLRLTVDTPLATSSNASSEISVCNNNGICLEASEREDDACSEAGPLQAYKGVTSMTDGLIH